MKTKCEHCGKMTNVKMTDAEEADEGPEVEVSIEGDADSIKSILSSLMPEEKDAA